MLVFCRLWLESWEYVAIFNASQSEVADGDVKSVKQVKDRSLARNVRESSKAADNLLNARKKEVCGLRDTRGKKKNTGNCKGLWEQWTFAVWMKKEQER